MYETKKKYFNLSNLTITTPSTWLANEVKMSLLSKHDVFVVSPGIDENIFKIKESEFKKKFKNKKIILCVANVWDLKKGLFDLYKLASLLEKQEDYLLVCVGGIKGKKEIRPNIYYVDQTNDIHELVDIYNSADVFVNLSYEETFGMVTIESLMCGTPVIVYNKTACPELVNSSCGKVVEAGNIELLFNTILTLPKFDKEQIRSNALKYTLNNMVNNYISLYK
jgi:glycosyltransferase involved in cell wall biosynthesis